MSPRGSARPTAGRPPLGGGPLGGGPPGRGRSRQVAIRWPEDEYDEIERSAEAAGVSPAAFVRAAARDLAQQSTSKVVDVLRGYAGWRIGS